MKLKYTVKTDPDDAVIKLQAAALSNRSLQTKKGGI